MSAESDRIREKNIQVITENEKVKADPTDGMHTMKEMDLEMPEGLAFQLGMNQAAMKNYSNLSREERMKIMEEGKKVTAKEQMTQLVDRLATNSFQ